MRLPSYLQDRWQDGAGAGRPFHDPTTGEVIGTLDATGLDIAGAVAHARAVGGPALRETSFAQRATLLRAIADALSAKRAAYGEIARRNCGNTAADAAIDIDGAIATLKHYARLGQSLGDRHLLVEPGQDRLAKDDVFGARHLWTTRPGVAIHINAYNFPAWGLWEKAAVALLAGMPVVAKPASPTAWLAHEMVRDVVAADVLPPGALSLVCGAGEGLIDAAGPMDAIAFTGSSATGAALRRHPRVLAHAPRLNIEADSVNATILGADLIAGGELDALFRREVVKALSVKAGQLCTNIRRIMVPADRAAGIADALAADLRKLAIGNPANEAVRVGPLVGAAQRDEALANIAALGREARIVEGGGAPATALDADPRAGAFVAPTLLEVADADAAGVVHSIEVFGPCATLIPCRDTAHAIRLALAGGGSLAASLFTDDTAIASQVVGGIAVAHGRVMTVDTVAGRQHTGHAIVMPQCVHGGPGRAGGGEELGGLRGLRFYMQRSALQGSPAMLAAIAADAAEAAL